MSLVITAIPRLTSFATPALTLTTANAAGSAASTIRSDADLLAFDATDPAALAFGDSGVVGVATVAARRDHVHPMPADPADADRVRATNSSGQSLTSGAWLKLGFDGFDYDNGNMHFESADPLTGTVDKTNGSDALAGTGTAFTTELSIGQVIEIPGVGNEIRVVIAIADDTNLTVNSDFANTASGQTGTRLNSAIVCRSPGLYIPWSNVQMGANSTGRRVLRLRLNDADGRADFAILPVSSPQSLLLFTARELVLWDFLEIRAWQDSGGALDVLSDGPDQPCQFGMLKVGG